MADSHRICSVDGCNRRTDAKGYCNKHYKRWRSHGDPLFSKVSEYGEGILFLKAIPETDKCILWPFSAEKTGYGHAFIQSKLILAHRLSYSMHRGAIPGGMCVLHSCDVRGCVNPKHLRVGTHADNAADKYERHRENVPEGEDAWHAKLTNDDAREILRLRKETDLSLQAIADRFDVVKGTIVHITTGKHFKNVYRQFMAETAQRHSPLPGCTHSG